MKYILPFLLLVVLSACGDDGDSLKLEANFDSINKDLFAKGCTASGCHTTQNGQESGAAGLNLDSEVSYANLVGVISRQNTNVALVLPGKSGNSYLINKLEGNDIGKTLQMPLRASAISQSNINMIKQWIDDGALQNNGIAE